jgi:restriction system protein
MTVCRIERNDAENRIRALLGKDASYTAAREPQAGVVAADVRTEQSDVLVNLDELAQDAIRKHIARNFSGHDLAGLVEAVLQAQGYKTHLSPPGPDGGVDVLCGTGVHGFDSPRLAVQVKSGGIEVDTGIFREFQGVMRNFGADHGLIVSWGGYKTNVRREMQREFFRVRMWGQNELIDEILRVYEDLPAAIKAKLPLKRSWILMQTSEEIT